MKNAIYRQGDVLIRRVQNLPKQTAQPRLTGILAYGEVTGHAHKVEDLAKAEVLEIAIAAAALAFGGSGNCGGPAARGASWNLYHRDRRQAPHGLPAIRWRNCFCQRVQMLCRLAS